jgi:drug/metabolite transporter (DMT)-like permease
VEILLALGAAVSYGASDFTGGLLSKTIRVVVVVLLSQLVSFALLLGIAPFWEAELSGDAIGWGAWAGLAGVAGTSLLYRGLAIGRMSVVAPITGILAAGVPALFGLAAGERPGPTALTGVGLGLIAVVIITRSPNPSESNGTKGGEQLVVETPPSSRSGVVEASGAGLGFGLFFVLLDRSPVDSGLWPLVGTRISMIVSLGCVVAIGRVSVELPAGMALQLLGLGFVNVLADLLYLLATRRGLLSLVAVTTSMYPAATVILARLILRERMGGQQWVGLGMAAVSVALIATG